MKRSVMFLFVLGLAFAAAPCVVAQTTTTTVIWGRNLPEADIEILNSTADYSPIQASVNHQDLLGVLDKGMSHTWGFNQTAWGWNGPMSVEMRVEVCRGVTPAAAMPIFAPPDWAESPAILGNLAINDAFLHSNPTKQQLKERVDGILNRLDGYAAKKEATKQIKRWYKSVSKYGSFTRGDGCAEVVKQFVRPIDITEYFGQRVEIYEVVGSDGDYRLIHHPAPSN